MIAPLVVGCLVGALLGVVNLYVGLHVGVTLTMGLPAVVLAFGLLRLLRAGASSGAAIAQTAAGAAMTMPSSGLVHAIPAMGMVAGSGVGVDSPLLLAIWIATISTLGVVLATWLRATYVEDPTLPYPTGTACAATLQQMEAKSGRAVAQLRILGAAFVAAAALRALLRALKSDILRLPVVVGRRLPATLGQYGVGFSLSPTWLGVGALLGLRLAASMAGGAVLAFALGAPLLIETGWVRASNADGVASAASKWLVWPGVGVILGATAVSLLARVPTLVRTWRGLANRGSPRSEESDVPTRVLAAAAAVAGVACVVLERAVFGLGWVPAVASVLAAAFLSVAAARAYGETDSVPSGPFAKLGQLLFAALGGSSVVGSLAAANVTAGAATHSAEMLGDLKMGSLLRLSPRRQLVAQLAGIVAGTCVCVPLYRMSAARLGVGSQAMPAPAARPWLALAETLHKGLSELPAHAMSCTAVAFLAGAAVAIVERAWSRGRRFLPSPMALGIGMLVPANLSLAILGGALLAAAAGRAWGEPAKDATTMVAAGLIVGDTCVDVGQTLGWW